MYQSKIISHRGANRYAPQNTMPAFRRSLDLGVDGFETDVHVSKDGHIVICHNYDVNATSNGMGRISSMTLAQLRELDFGSYYSSAFRNTKIPVLSEFLELVNKSDISIMNIELKSPRERETGIVKKTIDAVKEYGLFDRLLISSFDPALLVECKQIDPACKTGFLYSPNTVYNNFRWLHPISYAKSIGADALHPMYIYVNRSYVKMAHKAGLAVNVWTCDSTRIIKKMLRCGVDGIITDNPDRVKSIILDS